MGHLNRTMPGLRTRGALAGVAATLLLLGSADALARLLGASTSPLTAVGLLVIRVLPTELVKLAIALFGEADKIVLILTVGVAGLAIGGLIGGILCTRPRIAPPTFTAAEAVRRGPPSRGGRWTSSPLWPVPSWARSAFALLLGAVRVPGRTGDGTDSTPSGRGDVPSLGRRGFFLLAGASAVVGAVGIAAGRTVVAVGRGAAEAARRFVLPTPAVRAPAVPEGAEVGVEAMDKAIRDGKTGYCPGPGIPELRAALADDIGKRRGVTIDPAEVVVTTGGKPVITKFLQVVMDPGDGVLYPSPGFPIYESQIEYLGGNALPYRYVPTADGFAIDLDHLRASIDDKTVAIIYNDLQNRRAPHPSSPPGWKR